MTGQAPMEDVVLSDCGILYMQVCARAEVPPEVVEARANTLNPSGTSSGWHVIIRGKRGPVQCADYPERRHWMLNC